MGADFQPADLLLFAGDGWKSKIIALGSCWPSQLIRGLWISHVGVIAQHAGETRLFESTTLCDLPCEIQRKRVKGVQCHAPKDRIKAYKGCVWRLRLARDARLATWQSSRLTAFCEGQIGDEYDYAGLVQTGSILRYARFWTPPAKSMECSRYSMLALREAQVVGRDVAPVEFTPAKMERDLTHQEIYAPITERGASRRLK